MGAGLSLEDIYEGVREDSHWDHLRQPGIVLVPGRGQTDNPLAMLVGEAPGATENTKRRVFCGPSGRVLKGLMELAGLRAEDVPATGVELQSPAIANAFITNVVKYRPPGNRTPQPNEIARGAETLRLEWLALGRPKAIVAVGAVARAALGRSPGLKPGDWVALPDGRTFLYVQYHPAWGLRQGPRGQALMERQWEEMGEWLRMV